MTINLTKPAGTAQRDGHMTALSAAEHIISESPVMPSELETRCRSYAPGEPYLVLHFFDAPGDVEKFAAYFGLTYSERRLPDGRSETATEGLVRGVQVRAWGRAPMETAVAA